MKSMQTRILDNIERAATAMNLDTVIEKEWNNTGMLYFIELDGTAVRASMRFNFQSTYVTLNSQFTFNYNDGLVPITKYVQNHVR
jgi:hypothetical protein